jgi:alpha-galactosidase
MGILVHVKIKSREPNCSFQPVQVGNVPENVGPNEFSSSLSLIGRASKIIRTNGSWNQCRVVLRFWQEPLDFVF